MTRSHYLITHGKAIRIDRKQEVVFDLSRNRLRLIFLMKNKTNHKQPIQ